MHRITKGLDVPITGEPDQTIVEGPDVTRVALIGPDYIGMKPTMLVGEGDTVKLGQPVFADKKTEGVLFTAPASGTVVEVNRGERRAFQSVVIEVSGDDQVEFDVPAAEVDAIPRETLTDLLVQSGLWTAFRTRPYSRTPEIGSVPNSIFVQAIDSNPLAAQALPIIHDRERDFHFGLLALTRLTDGEVHVCRRPAEPFSSDEHPDITPQEFEGPHPAGLSGTHIHLLDPVGPNKTVWTVNYQDVIEIGHLVTTGRLNPSRVVSVAGPAANKPQLIRTRRGADIGTITAGQIGESKTRVISGSVLSGRAVSDGPLNFLGRFHLQVSLIEEGDQRDFLGWLSPGADRFSIRRVFASALNTAKRFAFSTDAGGSKRAMVPIGMYEQVMPLDIIPTFLLRALITGDTDKAQALGCLELDEEDLGLCTFVCPGKYEYGPILRERLTQIEQDG